MFDLRQFKRRPYKYLRNFIHEQIGITLQAELEKSIKPEFEKFLEIKDTRFKINWEDRWICLNDKTTETHFDPHYLYHTAWAARKLSELKPDIHYDFGSSLYFSAIASAICPINFYDFRPPKIFLNNLNTDFSDLTQLPFDNDSLNSVSCMHVIEHIGLGRYGDKLDVQGDIKAINELKRVVKPGGFFLCVVPIGNEAIIQYNAHRIYKYEQILDYFSDYKLVEFALISDKLRINPDLELLKNEKYACGCFLFEKLGEIRLPHDNN